MGNFDLSMANVEFQVVQFHIKSKNRDVAALLAGGNILHTSPR